MPSQALAFGELLLGGILATMGITGKGPGDVLKGNAKHVAPLASGTGAPAGAQGTAAGAADTAFTGVKGASPSAQRFLKIAEAQKGVQEGSHRQAEFASAAGISAAQAWCAAFVTWTVERVGLTPPSAPASVSSWEHWSGGQIIGSLREARPGDLLTFNGEHMGIYLGGGRMISGNWSNEVAIAPISQETEPLTAIVRIKGLYGAAARASVENFGKKLQVA
jgi:hypothetical protein